MPVAVTGRFDALPEIARRLRNAPDTRELFARGAAACLAPGGFGRAVVLSVSGRTLTAADCGPLADPASDQLRRRVLADPPALVPATLEAELVRRPTAPPRHSASALAQTLGLAHFGLHPVIVDIHTLALVVVDRQDRPVEDEDLRWGTLLATLLALTLEMVVMRERVGEVSSELRHFTTSTLALSREVLDGIVALPSNRGSDASLPRIGSGTQTALEAVSSFSERELRVVELLAAGHSNRAIAEQLVLSPETVKTHVSRILRKLGAQNRAEAVATFLRTQPR